MKVAAAVLCLLPAAFGFIDGVQPFKGTYKATEKSTFPVTFTWSQSPVEYYDNTISFTVVAQADQKPPYGYLRAGRPLGRNIDLWAQNKTNIAANTTFNIPVVQSALYNGAGKYTLLAFVTSSVETFPNPNIDFRLQNYSIPFTASF